MNSSLPTVRIRDAEIFERSVLLAMLLSVLSGQLESASPALGPRLLFALAFIVFLARAVAEGSTASLAVGSLVAMGVASAFGERLGPAVLGGLLGLCVVVASQRAVPERFELGASWAQRTAAGLVLGAMLGEAAVRVELGLGDRLEAWGAPGPWLLARAGAVLAFSCVFLASHVQVLPDAVRGWAADGGLARLEGRALEWAQRAIGLHEECRAAGVKLEGNAASRRLTRAATQLTYELLRQVEAWARAQAELLADERAARARQVHELEASATDPVAQAHLELAQRVLGEHAERGEQLRLEQQRAAARIEAQLALLLRLRGALAEVRAGGESLQASRLVALGRQVASLSTSRQLEADAMREAALGAELDQLAACHAVRKAR